ncbi:MAG: flagellar hook-basal body complex protein FliE [Polyangiaceae bacterium]
MSVSPVAAPQLTLPPQSEMSLEGPRGPAFEGPPALTDEADGPAKVTFADILSGAVQQTSELGHVAHDQGVAMAEGRVDDLHGTMIATKKAEISLHLVGSVRNKVLDAFHELWRMNV